MPGFVIRRGDTILFLDLVASAGAAPTNLVAGFLKVAHFDEVLVGHRRNDRGFVDQGGQIGATEHRGSTAQADEVDVGAGLDLTSMDRKDLGSSFEIRERNAHRPVESTGTREGGVEDVSSVGRGNHDDLVGGVEAIHLHQNRVERLFPFIMPTRGGPAPRRRPTASISSRKMMQGEFSLACLKRSRTRLAPTPTNISTKSEPEMEKNGSVRFAGDRLGEQRLPAARESLEEHAAGNSASRDAGSASDP